MPKKPQNFEFNEDQGQYKKIIPRKPVMTEPKRGTAAPTGDTQRTNRNDSMFNTNVNIGRGGLLPTSLEGYQKAAPGLMAGKDYFQRYMSDLDQFGAAKRGGGGGGGPKIPGTYDPGQNKQLAGFQGEMTDYFSNMLDPANNPFGQMGMNIRTRDIDQNTQQQRDLVKADFAARGQSGSPQEAAALRQLEHQSGLDRNSAIQQMKELGGNFSLAAGQSASGWASQLGQYDISNRKTIMSGQKMADDQRIKMNNAARGSAQANVRMQLQLAQMRFSAGRGMDLSLNSQYMQSWDRDRDDMWKGQYRADDFAKDERDFNRAKMLADKSAAAGRKSGLWGSIGGIVGGLLGPVGGAVGGFLGDKVGSLLGGGGSPTNDIATGGGWG